MPEGNTNLTADDIEPFKVGGYQLYFTAIAASPQAYQYYTFASPKSKYPDMTDENADLYTVYIKKHKKIRRKAEFGFADFDGDGHLDVELILGAGTGAGDMGRAHFRKTVDGLKIFYTSGTTANVTGTIEIRDDGKVYINGEIPGTGGNGNHIIIDHLPTPTEADEYKEDDVVLVHDPDNPYIKGTKNGLYTVTHTFVVKSLPMPALIEISGATEIQALPSRTVTEQYTATVYDGKGNIMPGEKLHGVWIKCTLTYQ